MGRAMRPSRVLGKLRAGEVALSFKLNLSCARAVEIAAMSGFDCVWVDVEHIASDWSTVESQIWAAKSHNTDTMVRVSRGSYSDYVKPLELDAAGLMVPHVMSAQEAEKIVRMTRFHPAGRRPVDGGNADAGYLLVDYLDYLKQANEERFIGIQIEDPEAMEHLEEIAKVEGIDMLFFGPGDFSHGMGIAGQMDHPEVKKARKRVAEAALKHNKFAGTVGSISGLGELTEMGYKFLNIGSDVGALGQRCTEIISEFTNWKR